MKRLLLSMTVLAAFSVHAQQNFTFTPTKPKAGEMITITYVPSGAIANTLGQVEAEIFVSTATERKADDLSLKKSKKGYTASISTDTSATFIQFAFHVEDKFDNNSGEGYYIQLSDGKNLKKGSNIALADYHQHYWRESGGEKNMSKALAALDLEYAAYPDQRQKTIWSYYQALKAEKGDVSSQVQKEIEAALKAGLQRKEDYQMVQDLYNVNKLTEQAKFIEELKWEKFPADYEKEILVGKYKTELDPGKKDALFAQLEKNVREKQDWKNFGYIVAEGQSSKAAGYSKQKDWDNYFKAIEAIDDKRVAVRHLNSLAWGLQEENTDLAIAERAAKIATDFTRGEMQNVPADRPRYYTAKQWANSRKFMYGQYADTYAMVMYRLGKYKEGFDIAKEAAIAIGKGKDPDQNSTYALLAEKALPAAEAKSTLEKFIKDGASTNTIKEILKRLYVDEQKSEAGFDTYIANLEKEMYLKMIEHLKKSMIDEPSPQYTLSDLNGNKVNAKDLQGKVVIVDFWATWCGPCKASFPAMQKIVDKYKGNSEVSFVFINTWERGDNKEKQAADFINTNKYTFNVLMDNESSVVEQFKVEGIPTKFVLDKNGRIRFKSVGYEGSEDKLINELDAMIEMA
ncbi:MAG TPA: TlpA disulfide reductase family protein, partial [Chryseosolibacter sp.]|nr:TlpA disulfide reductase family protein [Chryseosolibacter sp.]